MILGQDQAMAFPSMDLYDTGMMQMYVNAVQKEYERGINDLKEFIAKYGDFVSPIYNDVQNWNAMTMDPLSKTIDDMRAAGIDPLRDPEARAVLNRLMMNLPYGELARMRQSAKNADLYLKAVAEALKNGTYNPELEDFLLNGLSLNNWDTNKNGIWNRTGVSRYLDINNWTTHIFDGMDLSYDPEESKKYPGFMAYTKSKDTMSQILDTQLPGLLSSDLGRFYYEKLKNIVRNNNPGLTENEVSELAISLLKDDIIKANWENGGLKLEADPYYMAQKEHEYAVDLALYKGSKSSGKLNFDKPQYSYIDGLTDRGIINAAGNTTNDPDEAADNMMKELMSFGLLLRKDYKMSAQQSFDDKRDAYLLRFVINESKAMFASAIGGRSKVSGTDGVLMDEDDRNRLYSLGSVVTHTFGYPGQRIYTKDRSQISFEGADPKKDGVTKRCIMVPTQRVYTAFFKDGRIKQFWEIRVIEPDGTTRNESYWYLLPNESDRTNFTPKITEWKYNLKTGEAIAPKNKKGQRRDRAKSSYSSKNSGIIEKADVLSYNENKAKQQGFANDESYTDESISI